MTLDHAGGIANCVDSPRHQQHDKPHLCPCKVTDQPGAFTSLVWDFASNKCSDFCFAEAKMMKVYLAEM